MKYLTLAVLALGLIASAATIADAGTRENPNNPRGCLCNNPQPWGR